MPQAVVAGVSSGIGSALAAHLDGSGWDVAGTSRRPEGALAQGVVRMCVPCDFSDPASVDAAVEEIARTTPAWSLLVVAPGTMRPIGHFAAIDFNEWSESLQVNLTNQLRFVHGLLPHASESGSRRPVCLFFAGGGTNSAPVAFSSYTVAKLALIKAVEILDAESPDVIFSILGPGWVRTPIHEETLNSPGAPAPIVEETRRRLESDDFIDMDRVLRAIDWILSQPKEVVGGRNFSVGGDPFDRPDFADFLLATPTAFRLRRAGNTAYWDDHER